MDEARDNENYQRTNYRVGTSLHAFTICKKIPRCHKMTLSTHTKKTLINGHEIQFLGPGFSSPINFAFFRARFGNYFVPF